MDGVVTSPELARLSNRALFREACYIGGRWLPVAGAAIAVRLDKEPLNLSRRRAPPSP